MLTETHRDLVTITGTTHADAAALTEILGREATAGRRVNVFVEGNGSTELACSVITRPTHLLVRHGRFPASRHASVEPAVRAAVQSSLRDVVG